MLVIYEWELCSDIILLNVVDVHQKIAAPSA